MQYLKYKIILILLLSKNKSLSFAQMEIITGITSFLSSGWFGLVLSQSWIFWKLIEYFKTTEKIFGSSSSLDPSLNWNNDWRNDAFWLWLIQVILFLEGMWFFCKLIYVIIRLTWSILYKCISNKIKEWRQKKEANNAYNAVIHEKSWRIDISNLDPDEFWILWMEIFDENSKITLLPCNEKHYFHTEWISDWVKDNPRCPLWNTLIQTE